MKAIYFDMDGTFVDLYGENNWLDDLLNGYSKPYRNAKPLLDMRTFGKTLNALKNQGYYIGIVSWLAKSSTPEYDAKVTRAKENWLKEHLSAVDFDEIKIVPYGAPKEKAVIFGDGILFDDEQKNRDNWTGIAYDVDNILNILQGLL